MGKEEDHRVGWVDGDDGDDDRGRVMLECARGVGCIVVQLQPTTPPVVHHHRVPHHQLIAPTLSSLSKLGSRK